MKAASLFSKVLVLLFIAISITHLPGCSEDPPTDDNNGNPHDSDTVATARTTITLNDTTTWRIATSGDGVPVVLYDTVSDFIDFYIQADSAVILGRKPFVSVRHSVPSLAPVVNTTFTSRIHSATYYSVSSTYNCSDTKRLYFEITKVDINKKTISLRVNTQLAGGNGDRDTVAVQMTLDDIPLLIVPSGSPSFECRIGDSVWPRGGQIETSGPTPYVGYIDFDSNIYWGAASTILNNSYDILGFTFTPPATGTGTCTLGTNIGIPGLANLTVSLYQYDNASQWRVFNFGSTDTKPGTMTITRYDRRRREFDCSISGEIYCSLLKEWRPITLTAKNLRWLR